MLPLWLYAGTPLTASVWLAVLRYALMELNYEDPWEYTLHSLRRGGTQACAKAGLDLGLVREAGHWKSNAMRAYVPKKTVRAIPAALANIFG